MTTKTPKTRTAVKPKPQTKKAPKEEPSVNYNKLCYEELVKLNETFSSLLEEAPENPRNSESRLLKFLRVR